MNISEIQSSETPNETTTLLSQTRQKTPLPKLQIGILMLVQMAEPIASMSIYPYINQLIRELGITGGNDAAVGYYAGIIESLFFITESLTVLQWSRLSDRIGRKPVLLVGLFGVGVSMLCFGLSTSFWSLVVSRCICGMLNGNSGVMKSMMGELTDSTNMAQGFALIPITWCLGSFVGSIMGGSLARPQDRWPNLFPGRFWAKYPYFLPCAIAASVVFVSFMLVFLLKETLTSKYDIPSDTVDHPAPEEPRRNESPSESMANIPLRSLLIPSIMIPLVNQALFAFLDICIFALMPLFYSTPNHLGGLGFAPPAIGLWMGLFGVMDGLFQTLFFAKIVDHLGPKRTFYTGVSCFIPIMISFPVMSLIVFSRGVDYIVTIALLSQLSLIVTWDMSLGSIFMFITASAPAKMFSARSMVWGKRQFQSDMQSDPCLPRLFSHTRRNTIFWVGTRYLLFCAYPRLECCGWRLTYPRSCRIGMRTHEALWLARFVQLYRRGMNKYIPMLLFPSMNVHK